jgi:hypothetical protein
MVEPDARALPRDAVSPSFVASRITAATKVKVLSRATVEQTKLLCMWFEGAGWSIGVVLSECQVSARLVFCGVVPGPKNMSAMLEEAVEGWRFVGEL